MAFLLSVPASLRCALVQMSRCQMICPHLQALQTTVPKIHKQLSLLVKKNYKKLYSHFIHANTILTRPPPPPANKTSVL